MSGMSSEMMQRILRIADDLDRRVMEVKICGGVRNGSLADFSVLALGLKGLTTDAVGALVRAVTEENAELDRAVGSLVGNVLGDAVGAPLEFLKVRDDQPPFKVCASVCICVGLCRCMCVCVFDYRKAPTRHAFQLLLLLIHSA